MEFNREEFLLGSKQQFISSVYNIYKNTNRMAEFTEILGFVIRNAFERYDNDSIISELQYDNRTLENDYEFDEENFDNYFDSKCFIKNYKDAIAYYSLNTLFLEKYEKELESYIEKLFNS